ncbi:MAG: SDR family NAD(P)-dependent oxidoreductase [Gammaproteobacteria bacterium]
MSPRLDGKVALVTGSTAGCGRATAIRFAREGARVVVTGRNVTAGAEVVAAIRADGGQADFFRADLGVEDEVRRLVDHAVATCGRLDVLVNNASPTEFQRGAARRDGAVTDLTTQQMMDLWNPALFGYFWACRFGIAAMKATGGGAVVNVSSGVSIQGVSGADAYTAVKGAINATTRSMAVEYAPFGIRVNAIIVGLILTSDDARRWVDDPHMGPQLRARHLTRWGQPEDIANAALFLASDEAAFITGSLLYADGGVSINGGFPSAMAHPRGAPE